MIRLQIQSFKETVTMKGQKPKQVKGQGVGLQKEQQDKFTVYRFFNMGINIPLPA